MCYTAALQGGRREGGVASLLLIGGCRMDTTPQPPSYGVVLQPGSVHFSFRGRGVGGLGLFGQII